MMRIKRYKKMDITQIFSTVIMFAISLIILFPLANILIISVSDQQSYSKDIFSFTYNFRIDNYAKAWETAHLARYGMNTVIVCALAIMIIVLTASLCAYGIRRFGYLKEIGILYYVVISGLFIPIQAIILPLFKQLKTAHLMNNLLGLALIYVGTNLPLSMMIFTGFFKSIPKELEESATVDGCNPFKAYWLIIFPLSKTIMATVTILAGLNIWRDFFIPLVTITTPDKKTLGVGLLAFVDEFSLDWTKMCAAMVMQTIPIIALFLSLQKYFVSGVVAGAVKG